MEGLLIATRKIVRTGARGVAATCAGVAAFALAACDTASPGSAHASPRLPRVVQQFGRARLIRHATAGRVGDEIAVATTIEGRAGRRRQIKLTVSEGGRWRNVRAPALFVGEREQFGVTALAGRLCVLLSPQHRVGLRCLRGGRWVLVGSDRPLAGVREINDVVSTGESEFATTGGTRGHRPQVRILRRHNKARSNLGAVPGWAAQRGYFAVTGDSRPRRVCGAFNQYAEPALPGSTAPRAAPIGTFCITAGGRISSTPAPNALAQEWAQALPQTTSTASFDTAHSAMLTSGTLAIATNTLNANGVGTLVTLVPPAGDWHVSPLSSEQPGLMPYGGVWSVKDTIYRLDAVLSRKYEDSTMQLTTMTGDKQHGTRTLGIARAGFQVALGVYELHGRRYALFTNSDPAKPARTLAVPVD